MLYTPPCDESKGAAAQEDSSARRILRVGILGAGYWGPNIVRNFVNSEDWEVRCVVDPRPASLSKISRQFPGLVTTTEPQTLLDDPNIDAVAIVTPVHTHAELALKAIRAGKHVLVEKPLASTATEAQMLCAEAEKAGVTLMVDHTFLYTGSVEYLKKMIDEAEFGRCVSIDSVRINLGAFQETANVLYDLAPHDISILNYLLGETPCEVSAVGVRAAAQFVQDAVAYLTLKYPSGTLAHAHLSWYSPVKIRRMILSGTMKMAIWDDLEPSEKIRIFDKGIDFVPDPESRQRYLVSYRTGDMRAPAIDGREALAKMVASFHRAITSGESTRSTGDDGVAVLQILEAADASINNNGAFVPIEYSSSPVGR